MEDDTLLPVKLPADWLAQLQRVQDLLSQAHQICLVVLDGDGNEVTVPSRLPAQCTVQLARNEAGCARAISGAIARARHTRQAITVCCPSGRSFFVAPLGVGADDRSGPCNLFVLGGRTGDLSVAVVTLMEQLFRLVYPPAEQPSRQPCNHPAATPDRRVTAARPPLTPRECQVLSLIGAGMSNREIASRLFLSEATVKTHITHLLQKLGLANRTEAALYALREGILPPTGAQPESG